MTINGLSIRFSELQMNLTAEIIKLARDTKRNIVLISGKYVTLRTNEQLLEMVDKNIDFSILFWEDENVTSINKSPGKSSRTRRR